MLGKRVYVPRATTAQGSSAILDQDYSTTKMLGRLRNSQGKRATLKVGRPARKRLAVMISL